MSNRSGKPKIGITTWRRDLPNFTGENDLYTLHVEYVKSVTEAGGIPILLPHSSLEDVSVYLDLLDGLIITGGGDVDPSFYGEENSGLSKGIRVIADEFELALIQQAAKRNLPILGICRGFQISQVAFGGKMMQDIHDAYPLHPRPKNAPEVTESHEVLLEEDSVLHEIYGTNRLTVNSLHHQSVMTVGEGFKIIGRSPDGIVEAVQSDTQWFAFGTQWHPEKLESEGQKVFDYFVNKIKEKNISPIKS